MALEKSIQCQTDVALAITKHLFSKEDYQQKNLIFSPFSLHAALSVMAAGSQRRTLHELLSFLRFHSVDDLTTFFSHLVSAVFSDAATSSHCLSFANGMWVDESLSVKHSFKQLVASHYNATLNSVDFQNKGGEVCHEVNSWVEKETNGVIKELLPPGELDELTKLVFANALHFKGEWKSKFLDPLFTKNYDFHLLNGTTVKAPFMTSQKETQFIRTFDGFKVLRLSYKQGRDKEHRFSMYIFLPDAKDGLSSLIGKLASQFGFLKGKLPRRKVRVDDFKISFALEASTVLKELGVVSPFTKTDADFTNMVDSPSDELYVANLYHKASIEVNEQGTEAAATSSWRAILECCPSPGGIDFVADHPFLFLIREDLTGTVLFIGQVLNPLDGATTSVKKVSNYNSFHLGNDGEEEDEGDDDDDDDKPKVPPKKKKRSRKD